MTKPSQFVSFGDLITKPDNMKPEFELKLSTTKSSESPKPYQISFNPSPDRELTDKLLSLDQSISQLDIVPDLSYVSEFEFCSSSVNPPSPDFINKACLMLKSRGIINGSQVKIKQFTWLGRSGIDITDRNESGGVFIDGILCLNIKEGKFYLEGRETRQVFNEFKSRKDSYIKARTNFLKESN